MKAHSFKEWVIATRPWSFPASSMPVLSTMLYMFWQHSFINWTAAVWALLNIVIFHAAGNTWSDYFDYRKGVDAEDTFGSKILTDHLFEPAEIKRYALILLTIACIAGFGLMYLTGWQLLWFGIGGFICTILYPYFKFHALGDFIIMMAYAFIPCLGTSYVCMGSTQWISLMVALAVGPITVGILHANNTRDVKTDSRARISTFAMIIGKKTSIFIHQIYVIFPICFVLVGIVLGCFPVYSLLVLLALPSALKNAKQMRAYSSSEQTDVIADLDVKTAQLQLQFGMLLSISFLIAALL